MKYHAIILLAVAFALGTTPAESQETPCRDRLIKVCNTAEDNANPICVILRQDAKETPESIFAFLDTLGQLSESVRQDLICARLIGRKRVGHLISSIADSQSTRNYFSFEQRSESDAGRAYLAAFRSHTSTPNRWFLALNDGGRYTQLITAHAKLDSLNNSASRKVQFDFVGTITFVHPTYTGDKKLEFYEIHAQTVDLSNISTPHANGDLAAQLEAIENLKTAALIEYMNVGLEPEAGLVPFSHQVHVGRAASGELVLGNAPRQPAVLFGGAALPVPVVIRPVGPLFGLPALTNNLGGSLEASDAGESFTLKIDGTEVVLACGSAIITVGDNIVSLSQPPVRGEGTLLVPLDFLQKTLGDLAGFAFAWRPGGQQLVISRLAARKIPVLLDVVHLQGMTTLVLQFPEAPRYQVVRRASQVDVRMLVDRLAPPPQPTVNDPLVQGVTITPEQVRIQLAPGTKVSDYVLDNPFRIVFDVSSQE